MTEEVPLLGGTTEGVVRVGTTVRRPRTDRSARVERLLVHLEQVGAEVAPRFLGIDGRGRQVLEYVEGENPAGPPFLLADAAMESGMRLVRRFHDATVGTEWAEGSEVACHGDLGPHNTVFRGAEAVRLVDWDDDVTGGRRAVDAADAAWGFADLTDDSVPVAEQARRLLVCCEAYGGMTPDVVVDELLAQFGRARRNHLAAGRDRPRAVFDQLIAWTERNAQVLAGRGPDPR